MVSLPWDLVYLLGTGSRWQNNELRYSLRSISACLRMTRAQREKLRLLGGARWIREQIDLASVKEGET